MKRLPSFRSCFFCGSENHAGMGLEYFYDAACDRVTGWMEPEAHLCGYPGILHGGLQSALLDDVIYWAVTHRFVTTSVTVTLSTRFRAPALLGQRFTLHGWVAGTEGRKVTARGELVDGEGTVVAEGEGLYLLHDGDVFREKMLRQFDFSRCSDEMRRRFAAG